MPSYQGWFKKMNYQKECLGLSTRIENLRCQLNQKVDSCRGRPLTCEKTYALSLELDRLIYEYMKQCSSS